MIKEELSLLAQVQVAEIMYALGCTKIEAISHALESQHAFEQVTDDQIFNWLEDNHAEAFKNWMLKNDANRVKLESN